MFTEEKHEGFVLSVRVGDNTSCTYCYNAMFVTLTNPWLGDYLLWMTRTLLVMFMEWHLIGCRLLFIPQSFLFLPNPRLKSNSLSIKKIFFLFNEILFYNTKITVFLSCQWFVKPESTHVDSWLNIWSTFFISNYSDQFLGCLCAKLLLLLIVLWEAKRYLLFYVYKCYEVSHFIEFCNLFHRV